METVKEGTIYALTVSADEAFLSDPATVYPVTIDPDLTISDTNNGSGAIEDTTLFSGTPNLNTGDWVYNTAGYVDETYGAGRILVRLPGLYNDAEYTSLTADQITSAIFYTTKSSSKVPDYVNLYRGTDTAWSENSVAWNYHANLYTNSTNWGTSSVSSSAVSFNITSLVKAWRNGTYSAQAGFMLINQNETDVSKKFGIYSSEYSNTGKRPYFVLTYDIVVSLNKSVLTLTEGNSGNLIATTNPSGLNVLWNSSNQAVATVTSTGFVVARKAGTTVITASYVDSYNVTHSAQCTVYVALEDGIYCFDNEYASYRVGLESADAYQAGAMLYETPGISSLPTERHRFFKVAHLGAGLYSIRSMLDVTLGWDHGGYNPTCEEIGTSKTTVPLDAQWYIRYDSGGDCYSIYGNTGLGGGDMSRTLTCSGAVDFYRYPTIQGYSTSNASQDWQITKLTYSGSGIELRRKTSYRAVGDPFTFTATVYSSLPNEFGQGEINWSVVNGTGNASISENGELVGNLLGTVTVTARYSGTTWNESHVVQIIPADGIYLISNRQTGLYADVKDQVMADSSLICQWGSNKDDTQRWLLAHRSNGYFTIKSLASGSNAYYLSVKDNSTALSAEIVLASGAATNGMLWKLEPTTEGAFKLIPKSGEANSYVLATTTSSATNGATLIQGEYVTNTSYRDEWYVKRQAWSIGGGFAVGGDEIEPEETGASVDVTEYTEWWEACGYEAFYHVNPTTAQLNENSLSSAIVCFSSHGRQHFITLPNDVHLSTEIGATTIESEYEDAEKELQAEPVLISDFDLSGASLYIYNACSTAAGAVNLCTATIDAGAECVIGWAVNVNQFGSYAWLDVLQERLRQGATVGEAVDYANSFLYEHGYDTVKENRVYGNRDLVINPTARLSEDFVSFPAEEGLYTTPIPYPEHTEAQFKAILEERFDNYRDYKCKIEQSFLDDTKNNYVVDLHYYRAGDEDDYDGNGKFISLCIGYTAIVKNNVIVAIREQNMDSSAWSFSLRQTSAPEITQTIIDRTYEQLIAEMAQFDFEYTITEQTGQGVYDARTDTYYYELSVVYELVSGAAGVYSTRYRIPEGEIQ